MRRKAGTGLVKNELRLLLTAVDLQLDGVAKFHGYDLAKNLAAAEGHPAMVMDMSFANQALSAKLLLEKGPSLEKEVFPVPHDIDEHIAQLKLQSMGITIDTLTAEQKKYLSDWREGT